jgi:hypothetical protein
MRMRARRSPVLQSRGAFLFGIAFMGLFALIGSLILLGAWFSFEGGDLEAGLLFLSFGSMFFTAGTFGIWGSFRERRIHKRDLARKEEHPDEPWLWFDEWKDGRVGGHGREKMIVVWCVAIFWSAIVGSMLFTGVGEFRRGSPVLVGTVPFLAISVGFYVWAIRLTLRWRKFGASMLVLETFPGVIGGKLRATLVLPSGVQPSTDLRARLGCHRIDHSEEHGPESTLWHTEVTLPANRAMIVAEGAAHTVEFAIPAGLEPSSPLPEMEEVVWDVDVWGEGARVPYRASFQVPVFVTSESSDETEPEPEVSHAPIHTPSGARFDALSRIRVSPSVTGGYDFSFPYPRQAGTTAAIALALVLATAACVWFLAGKVPLWVPLLFGILDLLIVWLALAFWTRSKRVHVGTDGVRIRGGRFGLSGSRLTPRDEIETIEPRVMLEAETLMLHDLDLVRTDGKHVTVGIFIPSKQEAAWLAGRMRDVLEGR